MVLVDNFNIKKKQQEVNRLQREMTRENQKQRKLRTHHLIKKGAMLEVFFDIKELNVEETETLLKKVAPIIKKIRHEDK